MINLVEWRFKLKILSFDYSNLKLKKENCKILSCLDFSFSIVRKEDFKKTISNSNEI